MLPGPALRYLYEHQTAKSTPQSWRLRSTLPMAWAKSHPTRAPYADSRGYLLSNGALREDGKSSVNRRRTCHIASRLRYFPHREPLTSVVLDTAEKHECRLFSVLPNSIENIRLAQGEFTRSWPNFDDGRLGFETVGLGLGSKCILPRF